MAAFPPDWTPRRVKNTTFSSSSCPWGSPCPLYLQDLPPHGARAPFLRSHPSLLTSKAPSSPACAPAAPAAQALCPLRSAVNPLEVSSHLETDGVRTPGSGGAGDKVFRACRVLRLGGTEGGSEDQWGGDAVSTGPGLRHAAELSP